MGLVQEFKDFAIKGNAVDMAIGIIIGAAFGGVVKSLVGDVIMPPIGQLMGGVDFADYYVNLSDKELAAGTTLANAKEEGAATLNYGVFINVAINFLIVAFAVFMLVKGMNSMRKKEAEKPAEPAKPSDEVVLLTEIRDALAK